ncbi:MAG TPA: deoxyribodipyrimidine photo-lyase [Methylophilaceae bacterium]|nr:deoxyribodipyrimidine photo-lyase [Methylophilaceae bacterium]
MSEARRKALVWFRRDLRDYDHAALYHALKWADEVYCAFVFDTEILDRLEDRADRRVEFIHDSVAELKTALQAGGGDLIVLHGAASLEIPRLAQSLEVQAVYANRDYEPAANARDDKVAASLANHDIEFHRFKDQVIFERDEILTNAGTPFGVFTPYKRAWLKKVDDFFLKPYPVDHYKASLAHVESGQVPTLESMGFRRTNLAELKIATGMAGGLQWFDDFLARINRYQEARNFPAIKGSSYLSVHLRFGTVSIRHLARTAWQLAGTGAETWLSELIWRDFYFQVLHHHPQVAHGRAYQARFDALPFANDERLFQAWCEARTGYPLVDAAMRQLNQTGYMHNRLRMVTASFLVKDLLVDWRLGEQYFADKLIDFDLAANNGGWQWAASTGCDAQPWFRIFNPVTQSQKFDPQGHFIRKYVPELAACNDREIHAPWLMPAERQQALNLAIGRDYPLPVVDHAMRRKQALEMYERAGKADVVF